MNPVGARQEHGMRKIIVFNHVTLDGYYAGPNGELDWATAANEEVIQSAQESSHPDDAAMFGRVTYDMMAGYWPTPAAAYEPAVFRDFMNQRPKYVFSRTLQKAGWNNTTLLREIDRDEILQIKSGPGNNIIIFGSGKIVQQLTNLGLIDEYQLLVNPLLLGSGKLQFTDINKRLDL